jgi:hypothetical protein
MCIQTYVEEHKIMDYVIAIFHCYNILQNLMSRIPEVSPAPIAES